MATYTISQSSTFERGGKRYVNTALRDELSQLITKWQAIESDTSDILADTWASFDNRFKDMAEARSLFNAYIRRYRKEGNAL